MRHGAFVDTVQSYLFRIALALLKRKPLRFACGLVVPVGTTSSLINFPLVPDAQLWRWIAQNTDTGVAS
jgi:hypothetical protein